jgi:DNA-binding transcriptional regulator LsrR (DeoR family)
MNDLLKIRISRMYFYRGMTRQEIARRLRISRFRVSRLLDQALDEGIVRIEIVEPTSIAPEIEEQLEERFDLQRAIVVKPSGQSEGQIKRAIGQAAAEWLVDTLTDGDVLGIAWGTTVNEVVRALPSKLDVATKVVQVTGGMNQMAININAIDLTRRVAEICGAEACLLHAPAMVSSAAARKALLSESGIQTTLAMFDRVNIAVSGIGALSPEILSTSSTYYKAGYIKDEDLEILKRNQVVGDIFAHFFDIEGRICDAELEQRIVGMSVEQLRRVRHSIGVAGGLHKSAAILGTLRGNLITVLITDDKTAQDLLARDSKVGTLTDLAAPST